MAEINDIAAKQIEKIRQDCEKIKPLVAIQCITYNHELYIHDALEGFVMQKTNFPFVAIVHDDASTDGTAEIIREYAEKYPDIIKPIYEKENQYSKHDGSLSKIINQARIGTRSKYIAMCEGDDFWIDSFKLQKQVDFLESHTDFGMCFTKVKRFDNSSKKIVDEFGREKDTLISLLCGNTIPTPSVILSRKIYEKYIIMIKPEKQSWLMGDYPLWLWTAGTSKIYFMNDVTATYRILENSASHFIQADNRIAFEDSYYSIKNYFYDFFKVNSEKMRYIIERNHIVTRYKICVEYNLPFDEILKMLEKIKCSDFRLKLIKYSCNNPQIGTYINKALNLLRFLNKGIITKLKSKYIEMIIGKTQLRP